MILVALVATGAAPAVATAERRLHFNKARLDARGLAVIEKLEGFAGARLPDGDYWYDPQSGASGPWGGATFVVLPPGLPLGGALRPESSGGGTGRVTGVFVNGRELHPIDVANLRRFMQVIPGRYWCDGRGNVGAEGGPFLFNVYALARQQSGGGRGHTSKWGPGTTWTGGGSASSTWGQDGGRITNHCSYDPSDGAGVMCSKTKNW
jgi:hypothetical protein